MKTEIRLEIGILKCNYAAPKMEAISCLVPELQSEKHRGHGTQIFEKTQCFYVATCLRILLCYTTFTCFFIVADPGFIIKAMQASCNTV